MVRGNIGMCVCERERNKDRVEVGGSLVGWGDLWMCVCERECKSCVRILGVGWVRLMWGCLGVVEGM